MPPGAYSSQQMPKEKKPKGYSTYALNNYDPQQQQLHDQSFANVAPDSYTSRLAAGDESLFSEMEAPALKQFSGVLGGLGSRFSSMGTGGTKSSGFKNSANQASQDFAMQLQSQRQGLQRQAIMDLMGMTEQILGRKTQEKGLQEKPKSFGHEAGVAAAGGIGNAATSWALGGF